MFRHHSYPFRLICGIAAFAFGVNLVVPPPMAHAQTPVQTVLNLPLPGQMIQTTNVYQPPILRGVTINPDNPLQFDFLIDTGEDNINGEDLSRESTKLIKYFLATLTVPEANMWVNLSPFEKDRIIPNDFGLTEMGRDLLAQDYLLKQLTASLMYPEEELGKEFWERVYKRAQSEFGSTEIPVNTFNKVWIVPAKAEIYVHDQTVYVVNSRLKVMLEQDYLALEHHTAETPGDKDDFSGVSAQIVRDVLIPEIEREVNEGKLFANLRQIYASMILATWYKKNLKESFLGDVYVNKAKTQGIETEDKEINQKIYQQYLQAFKEGVYNYVKEEYDPALDEVVPRKYFSGGVDQTKLLGELRELPGSEIEAQLPAAGRIVSVNAGLRGEGSAGAQNVSYTAVAPTSDAARLTLYQPYRFGDATALLEGIRYQTPVQTEEGQKPGALLYELTPAVIQVFRTAFAGLTARTNHVESLTALKPLIEAMNQYPLRYKFSRERQNEFKLLEDQLKVIPTDGNRRRALIDQFSSLLNSLSDAEIGEILNSALDQFSQSLSYDARGFQNWEDITIKLMVNADAPFQMDQLEPGSAAAAELKVDVMTLLRGLTNKNFKLYWGMMRQRLIIDNLVRQRLAANDLPGFLKENPALLKEVLAILVTADTNYDLSHGTRTSKFNGLDRSPGGKEIVARYRNKIYEELAQDKGGRQYISLFKRLPKFTRAVNTDSGQVRYETDVPARIRAVFEFIAENPELRRKFDSKGTLDEASVTELGAIVQKIQGQQYDPIALSDRKPTTATTTTTAVTPVTTRRTTTPVYPTQKENVTVRAQELLRERTSTAREYTVSEQVSAYTQPEKPAAAGKGAARRKPEVRPEDKEENLIFIPLGVTSAQYVEQIKPALEAMQESRDTGVRTMIFLSHVWPQFLMANANEVGSEELRNLLKTAAGLLDPTVFDLFTRLADLSRDVKKNELLIRDIERELRNNSFLREQGVYVHLEVLTRWQNRPSGKKDQVSILSAVSYKIDEVEFDAEGQVDTSTEVPSILYLGDRIDRLDEDIRALGFTWIGDTFGVVLKDAIKNGAYSGTLPHLFDKPFTTYGQAQAHPLNQLIRTAVQKDYPGFPDQAGITGILDSRYRSTGIHERQHTRDELRGVQRHFSGVGMRTAQETTAYISSIVYGDAPFTDFVDIIKLHLNLRDGFGFFSDPNQIYTAASRNILELFADRLGVENFDLDEQRMLGSNAALLEKVLALNAGQLQALARSILDEVIDKQSRGVDYTAPKKIDVVESADVLRITEGKTVAITTEAIRPVIDILGVLLTKKPKTEEPGEVSRKKKIYVTAAGLVIAVISLSMYGSYVFFGKDDDAAQGINVEQPLEIKRAISPPSLLRDALNLNDADADRYVIRMEDYPRIREYLREIFNYDARPQDHILSVRDATDVVTRAGSTLSGISKLFFDDFFNYPAIHSANQAQYGLNPLPDARNYYGAVRGQYNLPQGIALVVPEGIEVEYEVQPGDSLTTIAQRFYGRSISGARNPLIAWDGVKERWIWERIAEHNGLSLPYAIREGQRLIIPTNKVEYGVNVLFNNTRTLEGDFSKTTGRPTSDKAVLPQRVGGIDLNPNNMQLNDTSGNEIRMNIPLNSQELYNIPVEGFVPVIINITPVSNLPLLLGISENESDDSIAVQDDTPALTTERLSYLPR